MEKRFNVRVYGLWAKEGQVLVSEERFKGLSILKFPGGGLEWGEGLIDGLKREWREEMGIEVRIVRHYYTTDFFQPSAFDDSQVLGIYYLVEPLCQLSLPILGKDKERFFMLPVNDDLIGTLSLPIDKIVGSMLLREGA